MTNTRTPPGLWTGQFLHFASLALLLGLVVAVWDLLAQPAPAAFWIAVAFPVLHQVFVWLAWRLELGSGTTSRFLGFRAYLVIFFLLFGGRFVSLFLLAWIDGGSLGLEGVPRVVFTGLLLLPGGYAGYSVQRYFGAIRAAGADHFDPKYRDMPLVREGIFRFTSNGMYTYAFLLFWAIAVGLASSAALVVAAFSHVYIWAHYHATEKPDMRFLYG